MRISRWALVLLISSLFCIGTSERRIFSPSPEQRLMASFDHGTENLVTNEIFRAKITPAIAGTSHPCCNNGFNSLQFEFTNVSSQTVRINWTKTRFIENGKHTGGVSFYGVKDEHVPFFDLCTTLCIELIEPKQTIRRTLFPHSHHEYDGKEWNTPFTGTVGVQLVVYVGEEQIVLKENLLISITTHE